MIASAKASFDTRNDEVLRATTNIVLIDRNLRQYGPEATAARALLRSLVASRPASPNPAS